MTSLHICICCLLPSAWYLRLAYVAIASPFVLSFGKLYLHLGQVILAHWNFPLQYRRCLMCLLEKSHKWVARQSNNSVSMIPDYVADELLALTLSHAHMYTWLDAPVSNTIVATNAAAYGSRSKVRQRPPLSLRTESPQTLTQPPTFPQRVAAFVVPLT